MRVRVEAPHHRGSCRWGTSRPKCLLGIFLAGAGEGVFLRGTPLGTTTTKSPLDFPQHLRWAALSRWLGHALTVPFVQAPGSLRLLGGDA